MIEQPPQIPYEVVDFANKNGYENVVYSKSWNLPVRQYKDYKVFYAYSDKSDKYYSIYILVKDNKIKFADTTENKELLENELYL